MAQYALRVLISAIVIVAAAEIGKRSSWLAAILVSLPITSILALSLLYYDTRDPEKVIALSRGILLMLVPSLAFFVLLNLLLRWGSAFWLAMMGACAGLAALYAVYARVLARFGVGI